MLDVETLKQRAQEGLALNEEAAAAVAREKARERADQLEQAKARRVLEALDMEPKLRAAAEEACADLRAIVKAFGEAVEKSIEARNQHEAVARIVRSGDERCPAIPSLKVAAIQDRGLFHDLDRLRLHAQRDF